MAMPKFIISPFLYNFNNFHHIIFPDDPAADLYSFNNYTICIIQIRFSVTYSAISDVIPDISETIYKINI